MRALLAILTAAASALCSACSASDDFPSKPDLSNAVVTLERSACLGWCPVYSLEVRGDGTVSYRGERFVAVEGEYSWKIPQSDVSALINVFRKADFFRLKDEYSVEVFDLPGYEVSLAIDGRRKAIVDYGGSRCDDDYPNPPCMPESVTEIEDAVDRMSGALSFIEGDDKTVDLLKSVRFDFGSSEATGALRHALDKLDTKLARELIEMGTPVNGRHPVNPQYASGDGGSPILLAPRTGDVELARSMITRGALEDIETRKFFVAAAAASGSPEMLKLALQYFPDLRSASIPWLIAGAKAEINTDGSYWEEEYRKDKYALWIRNFDGLAVVKILLKAGADPRVADRDGNTPLHVVRDAERATALLGAGADPNAVNANGATPLHETNDAGVARVLIQAGANPNARDERDFPPLSGKYDADTVRVLLDAGASIEADPSGYTPLFFQGDGAVAEMLIAAGADVNSRTKSGLSALTTSKDGSVTRALLRAGARVPDDQAEFDEILDWATRNEWPDIARTLNERRAAQTAKQ